MIDRRKPMIPAFFSTYKLKSMIVKLSNEDKNVDAFFDSHRKGLNKVATIAAGAIRARL